MNELVTFTRRAEGESDSNAEGRGTSPHTPDAENCSEASQAQTQGSKLTDTTEESHRSDTDSTVPGWTSESAECRLQDRHHRLGVCSRGS